MQLNIFCFVSQEDGFLFAAPKGLPIRRQTKMISEDTCSPFKYSPVKDMSPTKRRNSCPIGALVSYFLVFNSFNLILSLFVIILSHFYFLI